MKYCVVGPTYPFRGGIAHYTTMLVNRLRQRHEVRFYSYRRQYPAWLFPGNTDRDPSQVILEEACERTIDALDPLSWRRTSRLIVADRPDVLILQWWTPFWLPLLLVLSTAARRAGIPILYFCHQFVEPDSSKLEWMWAKPALRLGDAYVVLTQKEHAMARAAFPGKPIRAGHLPINDSLPQAGLTRTEARQRLGLPGPETPLLLFSGFVRRYKGLCYLLEALAAQTRPVRLLVAGEFWEKEDDYRQLIARLGLQERVTVHNRYVPNEELEAYFAAANALVLPYISGSQSGVGMLAVQHGVPIIATSIGGLAETVRHGETGLIVPPGDSAALAAAIEQYFSQALEEPFRAAMARDRERLSWPALLTLIEEVSDELTDAAGSGAGHSAQEHPPVSTDSGLQRG